ncbi:MAG: 1,4-dihydroxy-2-naphthoyl-CoA hydrolase [Holosporales bacterium]
MTKKISIEHPINIAFYDVDSMKVVWHGNYVKFLEEARAALLEKIDYSYQQMERSGYAWPVVDMHIRYIKPIFLNQKIIVQATLVEYENRLKIDFKIFDEDGNILTKAHTIQVAVKIGHTTLEFETPPVFQEKVRRILL